MCAESRSRKSKRVHFDDNNIESRKLLLQHFAWDDSLLLLDVWARGTQHTHIFAALARAIKGAEEEVGSPSPGPNGGPICRWDSGGGKRSVRQAQKVNIGTKQV